MSKVLAVAGAGATSAVLGSLFGVAGTVLGAAIGAVLTTVASSLYQRSLDRARSVVTSRIRTHGPGQDDPDPRVDPEATVLLPPPPIAPAQQQTELIAPADLPKRSRQRTVGYVVATVLGFALALGTVTGIEALKGSTLLQGESGTSVGRVLQGGAPVTESATPDADNSDSEGNGSSDGSDSSGRTQYDHNGSSDSDGSSGSADPSGSADASGSPGSPGTSATPQPRPTGGVGDLIPGGSADGGNG